MKIAILTTDTLCHTYFVQEIVKKFPDDEFYVFAEAKGDIVKYNTKSELDNNMYNFERNYFFGKYKSLYEFMHTKEHIFYDINDSFNTLTYINPDLIIVYGTGKIGKEIIDKFPNKIVNLHGGDPELYRGLDTNLWAIWHNDFENICVTLHCVDEGLDTGKILAKGNIRLNQDMKLYQLRSLVTERCIDIVSTYLSGRLIEGYFEGRKGRYYSAMPACLKDECIRKFEKYTGGL